MNKRTTLKYYRCQDRRLRRLTTYRSLLNTEYRIKVFPQTAQELIDEVNNER